MPCGATGQSVPMATLTPASAARRKASSSGRPSVRSFSRTGSGTFGSLASSSVVSPAVSVGTSHVPCSSISSTPSSSRNVPWSIERTPALTARLIPSAPCACDITGRPRSAAVSTIERTSASVKCGAFGSSPGDRYPPLEAILMTSAPARSISRVFRATPSTPSHTPSGMPGNGGP